MTTAPYPGASAKSTSRIPATPSQGPIHVVVDSTGVKVYGEGEWKVRQHGIDKRRTWQKLHVSVNEKTGEILSVVVSTNDINDDEAFPQLLDNIPGKIDHFWGYCASPSV